LTANDVSGILFPMKR